MTPRVQALVLSLSTLFASSFATFAATKGRRAVDEIVEVRLTQIELTVWPDSRDATACRGLTASDFRLEVNGRPREIEALDVVAAPVPVRVGAGEGRPDAEAVEEPLTLVMYFDLWHLELFSSCCGGTKHVAFEQARRTVREAMRPGDRLLLVTFAGWPVVHGGWYREPDEALEGLDRLEVSQAVMSARWDHSHHGAWVDGLESLLLALGRYPGRKEVLYLGDDLEIESVLERIREIGARAQANGVVMHAVDLVWSCRMIFCTKACGFCEFRNPVALGPLSWTTGGKLFRTEDAKEAVERIRNENCRYVLSFKTTPDDTRRPPRIDVAIDREGLTLAAPGSFEGPSRAPTEREAREALFLLPQFGRGVSVEAGLWPLRPTGRRDRWKAALVTRVRAVPEDLESRDVDRVTVRGVVHSGSKIAGEFTTEIAGDDLRGLAESDRGKILTFPVEVRSGSVTIAVNARDAGGSVEANFRASVPVPKPPAEGEARPWLLADGVARVGDTLTLTPSLDGVVREGAPKLIVGWGCPSAAKGLDGVEGALVASGAGSRLPAPVRRLDGAPADASSTGSGVACGWLVAAIPDDLPSGLWHFEPPAALGGGEPIEFRVAGR